MKAVMFDFDGTLTYKSPNIWKSIWNRLGYDTGAGSYFAHLYLMFMSNEITHQQWCDLTCEKFVEGGLNYDIVKELTSNIKLNEGASNLFSNLHDMGYSLHIISGSIDTVIKEVLGDNVKYFDSINGNQFLYDENNNVVGIKGTNYDFEGKAKFIKEFSIKNNISPTDICFVGNGDNDEWAHTSGCKTICINPEAETDSTNSTKWHTVIEDVTDLGQVLPTILDESEL